MGMWKDIDIFLRKKNNGDILDMYDIDAINNSLYNIFTTQLASRRMLPEFASILYGLLFEPIDDITARKIGNELLRAINVWETRITVKNINVYPNPDKNSYEVTLIFEVKSTKEVASFKYLLSAG